MLDHGIRLVPLGPMAVRGDDPALAIPAELRAKFPKESENHWLDDDGTWGASVEELVTVEEGKRSVERPRHRLHWLDGDTVRVAKELVVWTYVAFLRDRGIAVLACDLGELWSMDLPDGSMSRLAIHGVDVDERTRWGGVHALGEGRSCLRIGGYPSRYLVLALEGDTLRFVYDFDLSGDATVVRGRVLVGGADPFEILWLGPDRAKRVAQVAEFGGAMFSTLGGVARLYSREDGGWEVRGIDDALEAIDAGRVRLEDYVGPSK